MTEYHRLSARFRQQAEECSASFRQTADPAEAAAAYAYNEAAGETERLETKLNYWQDRCGKAEGAMLRMQGINSEYTRQIIESECEYGKPK